ncbi:hypothetical protein GGR07_002047 [Bacteroides pyogenes]|nr:hypothetical protein [Bacteroides pyogenes]
MKPNTAGFEKKGGGLFSQAPPPLLHSIFIELPWGYCFKSKHRPAYCIIHSPSGYRLTASNPNTDLLTASYIHQAGTGLMLQFQTSPCLLHHTFTKQVQAYCFNSKHRSAYCNHTFTKRVQAYCFNLKHRPAYCNHTFTKRVQAYCFNPKHRPAYCNHTFTKRVQAYCFNLKTSPVCSKQTVTHSNRRYALRRFFLKKPFFR